MTDSLIQKLINLKWADEHPYATTKDYDEGVDDCIGIIKAMGDAIDRNALESNTGTIATPSPTKTEPPIEYTLDDFKCGRVRIDFRNSTIKEIHQLCAICKALFPDQDTPAYTFGGAYFCNAHRWFTGGPHNLIGNKFDVCRVEQIKLTTPERESGSEPFDLENPLDYKVLRDFYIEHNGMK